MKIQRINIYLILKMTKRILVTGADGFVGRYMCKYFIGLKERPQVIGIDIGDGRDVQCDSYYKSDLTSIDGLEEVVKESRPEIIIHLAGTFGTDDSQHIYRVNVLSMTSLLEAARLYVPKVTFIATGSAGEYGRIDHKRLPVDENAPCVPITPYGLSKKLATDVAMYYHRVHGLCTMVVRPFQLIGKGVTSRLAPGAFAERLKNAISEGSNEIKVGNLSSSRDFLDVHDAVKAIWKLCERPIGGHVFNLCSGKPTKIANLLKIMIEVSEANVHAELDPAILKGKEDISSVYGSYQKIKDHCGWRPTISLRQSVKNMLNSS